MSLYKLRLGIGTLFLLVSASVVFAADDNASVTADLRMKEVSIIGSKFNIKDIAGSAAFLDTQDIRQHNVDDINRILRRVPGVNIRGEDGFGLFPNISLRGVDPSRSAKVTIMEDGILQAPAPYSAPDAYYSPTTGRMAGIEVLKGSSQIKYGPRSTGGAINFISTRIPTTDQVYIKSGFGSFNEIRTHMNFGGTKQTEGGGKFGYLIELYSRQNRGFKEYIKTQVEHVPGVRNDSDMDTGFARHEPMIKLSYEPKSNRYQRWEAKFGHSNLDANETYVGLPEGLFKSHTYGRFLGSRWDEIESQQFRSYIRHFIELSPKTSLTTTAYGNTFARNWQKVNKFGGKSIREALGNPGSSGYEIAAGRAAGAIEFKNNNRAYYSWGVQFDLAHKIQAGKVEHNLDIGVRFHEDMIRRKQWKENMNQDANGAITSVTVGARGSESDREQKTFAIATHIADKMKFGKFTFTPGIRVETIDASYCDKAGCGQTGESGYKDGETTYSVVVGGANAKYDWVTEDSRDIDIFGGVHRGFSPAGPKDKISSHVNEEYSIGMELGLRYANRKRAFQTEVVMFNTLLDDLVVSDSIGGAGAGGSGNYGDIHNYGLEYSINYDRGIDKAWDFQMPMYISATWQQAVFRETGGSTADGGSIFAGALIGNDVPYVPNLNLSFGIGAIFEKWSYNLDANYVSQVYADGANQHNQINPSSGKPDLRMGVIPARFVLDGTAGYQWNKQARLFANIKNMTMNEYMISRQPEGPRPGLPFSFMAGLEIQL